MRDHVIGYILACGIAHRLNELFSLFDKPQVILNSENGLCHLLSADCPAFVPHAICLCLIAHRLRSHANVEQHGH